MTIPRSLFKGILIITYSLKIISCANPVSPTGGTKDIHPPKIESFKITDAGNKKQIHIQFDENIVFQNNIELSPYKIKTKTTVTTTRNQIVIQLDSNTNSINFNDAIKDLNEGNKAILSNFIIGSDSSIKYYKIQSIPKNKDKILALSQNKQYIYPYNTTIQGYAFGEGLPNNKHLKTTIFLDQNKNQKYDSTEWAYIDTFITYVKPFILKKDSIELTNKNSTDNSTDMIYNNQVDTLEAILYPPINNEIKYYHDSTDKKTIFIIGVSNLKNRIKNEFNATEEHGDTLIFPAIISPKEIPTTNINFKRTRTTINQSSKINYYQYIYDKDTIYFQERNLSNFNIKKVKINQDISNDLNIKTSPVLDSTPLLDMSNPFTNPHGSIFTDIPGIQNEIEQIQWNLGIQFISFIQLQNQLHNELKYTKKDLEKIIKPKELRKLGKINFENDSNFNCGLSIYKDGKEIITFNCEKGNKKITLPVGNYQYFTWKDHNNDSICNQPEEILEYFFEMEVLEKIENTIIVKKTKIQEKNNRIPAIIQSE